MHHRLARPHRDPPERHGDAFGLQRLLDKIVVADRSAAGGDEDIGAAVAGAADAQRGRLDGVGGNAEIDGLGAFVTGQRAQRVAVGIDDLSGAGSRARHDKFVASGEDCDLRPAAHGKIGIVHASCQREIAVGEACSARQQDIAFAKIDAGGPDMPSGNRGFRDCDAATLNHGIFLDDHSVGAFGDHAAGEDPDRFALTDYPLERAAGGDLADHLEPRRDV